MVDQSLALCYRTTELILNESFDWTYETLWASSCFWILIGSTEGFVSSIRHVRLSLKIHHAADSGSPSCSVSHTPRDSAESSKGSLILIKQMKLLDTPGLCHNYVIPIYVIPINLIKLSLRAKFYSSSQTFWSIKNSSFCLQMNVVFLKIFETRYTSLFWWCFVFSFVCILKWVAQYSSALWKLPSSITSIRGWYVVTVNILHKRCTHSAWNGIKGPWGRSFHMLSINQQRRKLPFLFNPPGILWHPAVLDLFKPPAIWGFIF